MISASNYSRSVKHVKILAWIFRMNSHA